MPAEPTDRALVARWKEGDPTAFGTLHRRYYGKLYRFAYLRTGNAEDAADVASETFCRALHRIHTFQFRRTASIYPWLHQIAGNLLIDRARSRRGARLLSLDAQASADVDAFLDYLADDGPTPEQLAERAEVREAILAAIRQLPEDQGRAITFRFLGELSIREIAGELDRSEGAVKSLLHRALQGLRALVTEPAERPAPAAGRTESHVRGTIQT